jgi:hypothetical protein
MRTTRPVRCSARRIVTPDSALEIVQGDEVPVERHDLAVLTEQVDE